MSLHINSLGILSFTSCLLCLIMIYWKPARVFESQLAESILEGNGQLAFKKLATATLETLMPRIEGKENLDMLGGGWCMHPIPSLLSLDPIVDPFKSLANNISSETEVEVRLGKRLQHLFLMHASMVRQMKDSEMATQVDFNLSANKPASITPPIRAI
ncbi:hypothetical protein Syun_000892 [Stephania yunnanensis]|uniref:Uncharacterized protein n=1 Tax=Stephania yunnanensis TaxID=152371 RepID=A0AAP0LEI2_9MAGN